MNTTTTTTMLDAALEYAERGWRVFPLHTIINERCSCGLDDCSSPGKHPMTKQGCKDASANLDVVRGWWSERPDSNIGIATGNASDLAVLDVDDQEAFKQYTHDHGKLPPTLLAITGKGGHLYYRYAEGVRNRARVIPGVDVRGEGGYVVAPPSLHMSGVCYRWDDPQQQVAEWPRKLRHLLDKPKPNPAPTYIPPASYENGGSAYGLKILSEEIADLRAAQNGERNDTLNATGYTLFRLVAGNQLDASLVESELTNVARSLGLADREIRGTLESARAAGLQNPKVPAGSGVADTTPHRNLSSLNPVHSPNRNGVSSVESAAADAHVTRWPVLNEAALWGVMGEIVRPILPHTEADTAGLVLTAHAVLGALIGPGPFAVADGARHPVKLNAILVGRTSQARKGSSFANVRRAVVYAYPDFEERIMGGLASGEGLIHAVRDPDDEDAPPPDKRLLVYEPEWARVLKVTQREGNTLSTVIRELWDTDRARVMTRKDPLKASGTHVCIVGHITLDEVRRTLTETDIANGFANRNLFAVVRRSKRLPFGGSLGDEDLHNIAQHIRQAVEAAKQIGAVTWSDEARERWVQVYDSLDDEADGLVGAVIARAAPQMLRLAVSYAALDGSTLIRLPHLEAAEAVWRYCEESARYIFGDSLGDEIADRLLTMVEDAGEEGIDLTTVNRAFSNKLKSERLAAAYQLLQSRGFIDVTSQETGGRPRIVLLSRANKAREANKPPSEGSKAGSEGVSSLNSLNSLLREEVSA